MLDKFFTSTDKFTLDELLAENALIVEQGPKARTYNKSEWINLLCNHVVPAVPDYKWNHSTDAAKDPEGYCIVKVQARTAANLHIFILVNCKSRGLNTGYRCICRLKAATLGSRSGYLARNFQR